MTFAYSLNPKPAAFQNTMRFYRFQGIGGASWIKTTIWPEKRADQVLIDTDYKDKATTDNHRVSLAFLSFGGQVY